MKPYIGAQIAFSSLFEDEESSGVIKSVDFIRKSVVIIVDGLEEDASKTITRDFSEIRPANNYLNFLHIIDEWDNEYRNFDDPKKFERGNDLEQSLRKMYLSMKSSDQWRIHKIAEIFNLSK